MMDISSDIRRFERLSDDVLIKIAEGKDDDKKSLLGALVELSKRGTPRRLEICQELLDDPAQNVTVKEIVAIQIGSEHLAENQELLLQHLNRKEPSVFARIVQSLGKIGDEQALNRLEEVEVPDVTLSRDSLEFAKSLLAYRLRLDKNLIALSPDGDTLKITNRVPIKISKAEGIEVSKAFKHVEKDLPAIPLSAEGATKLALPSFELLLVFTNNFQEPTSLKSILDKSALPMVLLKKAGFLGVYFLSEYFFTHPSRHRKEAVLFGTRPRGNITYAGKIQISQEDFKFKLKSVDSLYVLPMKLEGQYDLNQRSFNFTNAISSVKVAGRKTKARTSPKVSLSVE